MFAPNGFALSPVALCLLLLADLPVLSVCAAIAAALPPFVCARWFWRLGLAGLLPRLFVLATTS